MSGVNSVLCQNQVNWATFAVLNSLLLEIPTDLKAYREYMLESKFVHISCGNVAVWWHLKNTSVNAENLPIFIEVRAFTRADLYSDYL